MPLLILLFFPFQACASTAFWIVGNNYVTFYQPQNPPIYFLDVTPTSWAIDPSACTLWVTDNNHLKRFSRTGTISRDQDAVEVILSDVKETFFTRANHDELQKRDPSGNLIETLKREWVPFSRQLLGDSRKFSLNVGSNDEAWIGHLISRPLCAFQMKSMLFNDLSSDRSAANFFAGIAPRKPSVRFCSSFPIRRGKFTRVRYKWVNGDEK